MKRLFVVFLLLCLTLTTPALAAGSYVPGDFRGATDAQIATNVAVVVTRNVTLRSLASYDGQRLASIPGETVLEVLSQSSDGRWLQVAYYKDGTRLTGWVLTEYVVQNPMTLILRADNVPAYAAPSSQSKKVGSLPAYTRLTVIGEWDDYYVVSLRNAAACIRKDARYWTDWDLLHYEQSGQRLTLYTLGSTVLRTGPGTDWASAERVTAGTTLEALSAYQENGWYVVRFGDGDLAYVNASDVQVVGGDGAVG